LWRYSDEQGNMQIESSRLGCQLFRLGSYAADMPVHESLFEHTTL
jgi:hypothetical protein